MSELKKMIAVLLCALAIVAPVQAKIDCGETQALYTENFTILSNPLCTDDTAGTATAAEPVDTIRVQYYVHETREVVETVLNYQEGLREGDEPTIEVRYFDIDGNLLAAIYSSGEEQRSEITPHGERMSMDAIASFAGILQSAQLAEVLGDCAQAKGGCLGPKILGGLCLLAWGLCSLVPWQQGHDDCQEAAETCYCNQQDKLAANGC